VGEEHARGRGVGNHGLNYYAVGTTRQRKAFGDATQGFAQVGHRDAEFGPKSTGGGAGFGVFGGRGAAHSEPPGLTQLAVDFGYGRPVARTQGVGVHADHGKYPESARFQSIESARFVAKNTQHA
jgi:hypothetical protein